MLNKLCKCSLLLYYYFYHLFLNKYKMFDPKQNFKTTYYHHLLKSAILILEIKLI